MHLNLTSSISIVCWLLSETCELHLWNVLWVFVSFFPQHESFQVSKGMFGGFFRVVLASLRGAVEAMMLWTCKFQWLCPTVKTLEAKSLQDLRGRLDRLEAQSGQSGQSGDTAGNDLFVGKYVNVLEKVLTRIETCKFICLAMLVCFIFWVWLNARNGQYVLQWCTGWTSKKHCRRQLKSC